MSSLPIAMHILATGAWVFPRTLPQLLGLAIHDLGSRCAAEHALITYVYLCLRYPWNLICLT